METYKIESQVDICLENGSRWIQLETADVARILGEAAKYRWLREHLEFINFEGGNVHGSGHFGALTSDTSDDGLDYAIDCRIAQSVL